MTLLFRTTRAARAEWRLCGGPISAFRRHYHADLMKGNDKEQIHIIGPGHLGQFIAHGLGEKCNPSSVTLCFRTPSTLSQFIRKGSRITITPPDLNLDGTKVTRSGFKGTYVGSELADPAQRDITNAIVATKAYDVVAALRMIEHRVSDGARIVLLQNGMGVMNEIDAAGLFTGLTSKPSYYQGICTHGIRSLPTGKKFEILHAGRGSFVIGQARHQSEAARLEDVYLGRALLLADSLACTFVSAAALQLAQLEKLVVNAVINPITALYRVKNGKILDPSRPQSLKFLFDHLLGEAGAVARALQEEDGDGTTDAATRLSDKSLESQVVAVAEATSNNVSSMLRDVMKVQARNEVKFINGFIADQGRRLGIKTPANDEVVRRLTMIKAIPWDSTSDALGFTGKQWEE